MSQSTSCCAAKPSGQHLERDLRQLNGAGSVSTHLGVLVHTLEAAESIGTHGMTQGGAYVDAVGLARGRSPAIPPWPDQGGSRGTILGWKRGPDYNFLAEVWRRCS